MNSRTNTVNEDIMNEITGIEYEDDDALTLLDDEEMQNSVQTTDDEVLNSFYLGSLNAGKDVVELPTEEVVKKEEPKVNDVQQHIPPVEPERPLVISAFSKDDFKDTSLEVKPAKRNGYQNKLDQLSTNIDAYLNGSLDNRKDEVKVEKMESIVVKAPQSISIEKPIPQVETNSVNIPSVSRPVTNQVQNSFSKTTDNNLDQLFAKASDNIRGVTDVKRKMEDKYREIQKMYEDFEKKKKADYEEINAYKNEVYNKLKVKKDELDEQSKKLKLEQDALVDQRKQLEVEKQRIREENQKKEKELLDAFKEREKNIEQVENGLIKRKEQLDLEKIKIAKERAQCEQEKKELADNLVKFNQLVDEFTKGVDRFNDNN